MKIIIFDIVQLLNQINLKVVLLNRAYVQSSITKLSPKQPIWPIRFLAT